MKTTLYFVLIIVFALSSSTMFASTTDLNVKSEKIEVSGSNEFNLSEEEVGFLVMRVEEIRDMDKSNLTSAEKTELQKELKDIRSSLQRSGGFIYVSVGTLILILLLVLLLR
jgi:chemotaxis signal transduction protein